jgi:23S rRNA-intervening sequence protein
MRNYEDLEVWQRADALTITVYRVSESFPRPEMFGLTRACFKNRFGLTIGTYV